MKKVIIGLIVVGLSIISINAKKKQILPKDIYNLYAIRKKNVYSGKILPNNYYDLLNKYEHIFHIREGGVIFDTEENQKEYVDVYIKLINIFNRYYTNTNVNTQKMQIQMDLFFNDLGFVDVIKKIYGEAEYKKYRKILFGLKVRKSAFYLQKQERWSYKIAMDLGYVEQISSPFTGFLGGRNLEKGEQKLKELMDRSIYSISTIIGYFSNIWYQDRKSKKVVEWYEKYKDKIPDSALMRNKFMTDLLVEKVLYYYKANGKESRGKELQQQFKDRIAKLKEKGMKYKYIE